MRLLRKRLGYGTVGGLVAWLSTIAVVVGLLILLTTAPPTD